MSLVVTIRVGSETTEIRAQRITPDTLLEGNLLLEGVGLLELSLTNGDRMLPHTMSVPRASVIGYYGGEVIGVETLVTETESYLKELSKRKTQEASDSPVQEWRGIEGTTYTA